jgi:translation initiation factor IF-2
MTVSSKVRIYDLAKELKLDTKRLIEEVRREGVDVSVPSNSVSKELAEKIRNKYFPKKETAVKRVVKVVKRAAMPASEAPAAEAELEVQEAGPDIADSPASAPERLPHARKRPRRK